MFILQQYAFFFLFLFIYLFICCLSLLSAKAKPEEPEITVAADAYTQFKHLLLPITDRNPYLSEGTRQVNF